MSAIHAFALELGRSHQEEIRTSFRATRRRARR